MTTTTPDAPYRTGRQIELEAQYRLQAFGRQHVLIVEPPVPITGVCAVFVSPIPMKPREKNMR